MPTLFGTHAICCNVGCEAVICEVSADNHDGVDLTVVRGITISPCNPVSIVIPALADTLKQAIDELAVAIPLLRDMSNKEKVLGACVRINSLENQADDIFEYAIADLFKKSKDPLEIIKTKEVLVGLETATDKCEDAANALESIILKNT